MSQNNVILLLGTNLGDRKKNIFLATEKIEQEIGSILKKSQILETSPVEFCSSNNFINSALLIKTVFSPTNLLLRIKKIEKDLGRLEDSSIIGGYADRIIDIDIVKYSNITFISNSLVIPHYKHIYERKFSKELLKQII